MKAYKLSIYIFCKTIEYTANKMKTYDLIIYTFSKTLNTQFLDIEIS